MNESLTYRVIRWLLFIPVFYGAMILFKICMIYLNMWCVDKLEDNGALAYAIITSGLSLGWLIFFILYIIQSLIVLKFCPNYKIGAPILLVLFIISAVNYYFIGGGAVLLLVVLSDLVIFGSLLYFTLSKDLD